MEASVGSFSAARRNEARGNFKETRVGGGGRARRMRRIVAAVSVYKMSIAGCKSWCGMGAGAHRRTRTWMRRCKKRNVLGVRRGQGEGRGRASLLGNKEAKLSSLIPFPSRFLPLGK